MRLAAKDSRLEPGGEELLERARAVCLALPEATEGGGVGNPSWRVRDKIFAMRHDAHPGRWGIWCKAPAGAQRALVEDQDWDLVADLIEAAYRLTAPKRLLAMLDGGLRRPS